jgi:arabinose-5-phosphate isomerase
MNDQEVLLAGKTLIHAEALVVELMAERLGDDFVTAARLIAGCTGKILVTGAGTSGTMARRLAHMLATCGMSAFFAHAADALHGPSAAVAPGDILIAFSKAGKSAEINQFAGIARQRGAKVIAMTWEPDSPLGRSSDIVLNVNSGASGEGDGVLPFGSTLAAGAVSDALVHVARRLRGFDLVTLAQTHPSGGVTELLKK